MDKYLKIWGIEPRSERPDRIIYVYEALKKLPLPENFSMIDIACGHGVVMNGISKLFPKASATILDIRYYKEWENIRRKVERIEMPLQSFIKMHPNKKYDVVMMYNSYRQWRLKDRSGNILDSRLTGKRSARRGVEADMRREFDKWLIKNVKYFITSGAKWLEQPRGEIDGKDVFGYPLELYKLPLSKV